MLYTLLCVFYFIQISVNEIDLENGINLLKTYKKMRIGIFIHLALLLE